MTTWILEPGHTEVEFRAMHMMVTWVRGMFKDVHGRLEFDWDTCLDSRFEGEIDAAKIWTGEPDRDAHLRSADFFDTDSHPLITFSGRFTERTGDTEFKATADVTIRGVTQTAPLAIFERLSTDFPAALALSAVLVAASAVLLLGVKLLIGRGGRVSAFG